MVRNIVLGVVEFRHCTRHSWWTFFECIGQPRMLTLEVRAGEEAILCRFGDVVVLGDAVALRSL
jgi:hypothetical protein